MKKFLILFTAALILTFGGINFALAANPPAKPASTANDFKTYMAHASKALTGKDYNTAIINFKKAIEINPNNYEAYCALGMSYGYLGKIKEAEETLILATKKFPNEWMAYTFLGDIKQAQHLTPLAIEYYKKAMSLPSMPQENKVKYEALIQKFANEQKSYEGQASTPNGEKISIELDKNWTSSYFKGTDQQWIKIYHLVGEDSASYKWTKLITVNFFADKTYHYTADYVYNTFCGFVKQQAKILNSEAVIEKLSSTSDEIIFTWKITGRGESAVARIFKQKSGIYSGGYEHKKDSFTPVERAEAIRILKSIKEL